MSALAVLPRPATTPTADHPGSTTRRRGHLALVGADFVPAAQGPSARPVRAGRVRLTRRGRQLLAGVAFVAATGASVGVGAVAGLVASADTVAQDTVTVSVAPGDTLWGLAAAAAGPQEDVREVVERIVSTNALDSHDLHVGQRLQLPG